MVKFNKEQLKKLNIQSHEGIKKKSKTPMDRFLSVIEFNKDNSFDTIEIKNSQILINLKKIRILSNNDMLRIDNRKLTRYKNQCKNRITSLVNTVNIEEWKKNTKNKKVKLEYIYSPSHGKKMDTVDGITGAFKYLVDGLTISELIIDDSDFYLPLAISKQFKGDNEIWILLSIIDDIDKYYSPSFKEIIIKNSVD